MKNHLKYLLALTLGLAVFGAVACSDDSSSSTAADDGKNDSFSWDGLQIFDGKADLPSCKKFDGVAQVIDEKAFFVCLEGVWTQIGVSAPSYDELPKCNAPMNDFCIGVGEGEKTDDSYICDEGTWVKGVDGGCLKGDDNPRAEIEKPCSTPHGLRLNCYENEKREMKCITESYGGGDGIMKNGVCVVDEKKLNKELEKKLQAMQEKFEKEMQDLDDKYEKEMQDLKNEYEKEKQALIDEYERRKRGE